MLQPDLAARLISVGLDPGRPVDPDLAWSRLRDRFGDGATLADRYALEAEARGVGVDDLDPATRRRAAFQVIRASFPGFEWVDDAARPSVDPVEVVPYDPAWPGWYAAWRRKLAEALGPTALRIEHVGSTAVPGLVAKPVIDVQVSVIDLEDEPRYVPPIEGLGVALRARDRLHRYFRPPDGSPRVVQVHVCPAASDWERDHLLFRDTLRAHAETARAYGALKQDLARRHRTDRLAYTDAKGDFIRGVLERARAAHAARTS